MARIRTIKPEFWQDEDLAETSEPTRLLAIGLLNCSDDEGYFNANYKLLEASIFPLTDPSMSVHECLKQLCEIGYVKLYKCSKGRKTYGQVVNFMKHQKVNRPTPSKIRADVNFTEPSLSPHEPLTGGKERKGTGKGKEQGKDKDTAFNFKKSFLNLGVQEEILNDWLLVRKKKKSSNTQTAFNSLMKEIEKSNLSTNEAIRISAENSWAGFKNEWVVNNNQSCQPVKNNIHDLSKIDYGESGLL